MLELLVHKRVFILEMFQYPIIFQLLILTIYNCLNHRNSTKKCQLSKHSKVVLSGCYIACNMFNEVYCFVNLSHILKTIFHCFNKRKKSHLFLLDNFDFKTNHDPWKDIKEIFLGWFKKMVSYLLYQRGAHLIDNHRQFLSLGSQIYLGSFRHIFGFSRHQNFNWWQRSMH